MSLAATYPRRAMIRILILALLTVPLHSGTAGPQGIPASGSTNAFPGGWTAHAPRDEIQIGRAHV